MEKVFMLTVDGTSSGKYENLAYSLLFATREEAEKYIESDFVSQAVKEGIVAEDAKRSIVDKVLEDWCIRYDKNHATFKFGDAMVDYRIEEIGVPT